MTRRMWFMLAGAVVAVPAFIRALKKPTKPAIPSIIYLDVQSPKDHHRDTLWQFTFDGQLYQWSYNEQTRQLLSNAHTAPVSILQEFVRHLAGENIPRSVFQTRFVDLIPSVAAKTISLHHKYMATELAPDRPEKPTEHVYDFKMGVTGEQPMYRHIVLFAKYTSPGHIYAYPLYPEFRDGASV